MKFNKYTKCVLVSILFSCSPNYTIQSYDDKVININSNIDSTILSIIKPYQNDIEIQMNEVLCYTKNNLEKGKPQSTIGNFVTDLCLNYADAQMCVMNNGGLRTNINIGDISKGKIFKLMPFENELVVLELDKDDYLELLNYITKRGGEPFSGVKIEMDIQGNVVYESSTIDFTEDKIKVITSDYLANGGDEMWFFKDKKQEKVGIKLRDAIIDFCSKIDTLDIKLDDRIKIISHE